MASSLTIQRLQTIYLSNLSSYQLTLTVSSYTTISPYVFVKQRRKAIDKVNFDDVFAAVCTPAQLAELDIQVPSSISSYYRDNTITLTSVTLEHINFLFTSIMADIQKLITDYDYLQTYSNAEYLTVSSTSINPTYSTEMPPITLIPVGTSPIITIDPTKTNLYILNLIYVTGTPILSFVNLTPGQIGQIEIKQPTATNLSITFPTGAIQGQGGANTYVGAGANTTDLINWSYDGTRILFNSEKGYN